MPNLIGSRPEQVPTNNMLGGMAFEDPTNYALNVGARAPYANGQSGASKTIIWAEGMWQTITLDANCTLVFDFTGCIVGQYRLILSQDATGGRTATWSTNTPGTTKWIGSVGAPMLNGEANAKSFATFFWDGADCYGALNRVNAL